MSSKTQKSQPLTLIGKSRRTHPEIFPKFQFSGSWHRPISGKVIQCFFQNFNFRGMSVTDCWKIHPSFFVVFSFYKILWHELDRLQIWTSFPEMGHFSTKCSILDEFSRNWPVSCPKIIKLTIGWVFQKSVMPRKFSNKG